MTIVPERCYLNERQIFSTHLAAFERKGSLGEEPTQNALRSRGVSDQPIPSGPVPGVSPSFQGEAFMEAFLADGLGGSQGGSHGRFRQVSLFGPTHQTEVLSGPRLVLTLGRK